VHAARPLPRRTRHECAHESPRDADLRPVPSRGTTSRSAPAWSAFKCPNLRSRPPRAGGRPRKYASSQALRKIGETGTARAAALAARCTGYEPLHPRAGAPAAVIPHWRSRKSSRLPREAVSLRRSRSRAAPECPVRVGSRAGTRGIRAKPQFMPLDQFRDVLGALASPHAAGRLRCMGCKLGGGVAVLLSGSGAFATGRADTSMSAGRSLHSRFAPLPVPPHLGIECLDRLSRHPRDVQQRADSMSTAHRDASETFHKRQCGHCGRGERDKDVPRRPRDTSQTCQVSGLCSG
jgi:hypothetical protein